MDRDEFDRAAFGIDVVFFPLFGVVFAAFSSIPLLIGSFRLNGELVTFADQPLKFVGVVVVGMLIGFACCFYGWLRYRVAKKTQHATRTDKADHN